MNTHEFDRVKYSLLKEIDLRFQRSYHERLSEIINDLRMHHAEIKPDANADEEKQSRRSCSRKRRR